MRIRSPSLASLVVVAIGWFIVPASAQEFCYGQGQADCPAPDRWPGSCNAAGSNRQSPVDIFDSERARLPQLIFRYRPTPLKVIANGHTVEVEYEPGRGSLQIGRERCELRQFHFHTTAEHAVGGTVAPLEAHLVHACPSGRLAVVGVLMRYDTDEPNAAVAAALDNVPKRDGTFATGERVVAGEEVDADALLPDGRSYFGYSGSLTTPPCSEIVSWMVLREPVSVSRAQVEQLRAILAATSPNRFDRNNRPLQDLEARTLRRSLPPR